MFLTYFLCHTKRVRQRPGLSSLQGSEWGGETEKGGGEVEGLHDFSVSSKIVIQVSLSLSHDQQYTVISKERRWPPEWSTTWMLSIFTCQRSHWVAPQTEKLGGRLWYLLDATFMVVTLSKDKQFVVRIAGKSLEVCTWLVKTSPTVDWVFC